MKIFSAALSLMFVFGCVSCASQSGQQAGLLDAQPDSVKAPRPNAPQPGYGQIFDAVGLDTAHGSMGWGDSGENKEPAGSLGTENRLSEISREIAEKVYAELKGKAEGLLNAKVAVTVAVPLSDFKRETEFGRLLAENTLTDLSLKGLQVTELRLGKEIIILPQTGEFIMSRNMGELLHTSPDVDYVVISTFTNTRSTLIIQGRLVGAKTGIVETSWRHNMELNREVLALFYDPQDVAPVSMKSFAMKVKGLR